MLTIAIINGYTDIVNYLVDVGAKIREQVRSKRLKHCTLYALNKLTY